MTKTPTVLLTFSPSRLERLFPAEALEQLRSIAEVRLNPHEDNLSTDALIQLAEGCHLVIADRVTPGAKEFFQRSSELIGFIRPAMDIRNIDLDAADAAEVLVVRGSPGWVDCVTELILGQLISLVRHIPDSVIEYRSGTEPVIRLGSQLAGRTLGIIGYGNLGRRVAEVGVALKMKVVIHDPFATDVPSTVEQVALDDLVARSDFVACLIVHSPATENLVNERLLRAMRTDAYLINASRGGLVDERALERALTEGWIAGAVLDVGREPDDLPNPRIAALPNVVATPHVGGYVQEAIAHHAFESTAQVAAILRGERPAEALNWDESKANRIRRSLESIVG